MRFLPVLACIVCGLGTSIKKTSASTLRAELSFPGRSITFLALYLQAGFHTLVSQHRNKGLYARRAFELIAFDSVDFLHRINGGTGFTCQQFDLRFSRNG